MAASTTLLLPGDPIPTSLLPPPGKNGTLTLGPNIHHIPPSTLLATTAGPLFTDPRKHALWLETASGRYQPAAGDLVIAQIHHGGAENYACALTPHTPLAALGNLAFEGANKKTRPQLKSGDLVYARVSRTAKWEEVELECVSAATGKADGLGPLKGGMVFDVAPAFARRLMMGSDAEGKSKGGVVVLELLGEKVRFEVAVGRNGRLWVESGSVRETLLVGRLVQRAGEEGWSVERQGKEIKKALKEA